MSKNKDLGQSLEEDHLVQSSVEINYLDLDQDLEQIVTRGKVPKSKTPLNTTIVFEAMIGSKINLCIICLTIPLNRQQLTPVNCIA